MIILFGNVFYKRIFFDDVWYGLQMICLVIIYCKMINKNMNNR